MLAALRRCAEDLGCTIFADEASQFSGIGEALYDGDDLFAEQDSGEADERDDRRRGRNRSSPS